MNSQHVQQKRQDPLQQSMNQVTNATNKSTTTVAVVKKKIMFTVMFAVIFKGQWKQVSLQKSVQVFYSETGPGNIYFRPEKRKTAIARLVEAITHDEFHN